MAEMGVVQNSQPDRLEGRDRYRAPFALQLAYRGPRVKVRRVTVSGSCCQTGKEKSHTAYVVQRKRGPNPVILGEFEAGLGNCEPVSDECLVGQHDPFWIGGRARGVHDDRRVPDGDRSSPVENCFIWHGARGIEECRELDEVIPGGLPIHDNPTKQRGLFKCQLGPVGWDQ